MTFIINQDGKIIIRTVHEIRRRISMQSTELPNYMYKQHGRY